MPDRRPVSRAEEQAFRRVLEQKHRKSAEQRSGGGIPLPVRTRGERSEWERGTSAGSEPGGNPARRESKNPTKK